MHTTKFTSDQIKDILEEVKDPEIPVLSVVDMGVIRDVRFDGDQVVVIITPTYSGCPAMKVIEDDIVAELKKHGIDQVKVETVLSPAWTTDWLTDRGKKHLLEYGIAPPDKTTADKSVLTGRPKEVACPRCGSKSTKLVSQFGSTACKALYQCNDCLEPFDYFKCI